MREAQMDIVDLSDQYEKSYLVCLEDWSDEMAEAGDHKARWYRLMRDRGLRVKLALGDDGRPVGMIQYLPIEHSPAVGIDLYMIMCVWVHGYKGGVGNRQGRGVGSALLAAAERDTRELGAKGIVAWGVVLPFWMKAGWFKKHGYRRVDRIGIRALMWKPFMEEATAPHWIEEGPKPTRVKGKVAVTAFVNGWCPASNIVYERAKRAAAALGDDVVFESIDTSEQSAMIECGQSDCVLVDGKTVQKGPPPSYDRVYKMMAKRARKLRR
ncbi:MAG: GNAT family N-acetyltransferase [Acidimicrobiia bacterium]|nr:GNAT family N-acetyltransferase [Acidimicrobiia bacterium]